MLSPVRLSRPVRCGPRFWIGAFCGRCQPGVRASMLAALTKRMRSETMTENPDGSGANTSTSQAAGATQGQQTGQATAGDGGPGPGEACVSRNWIIVLSVYLVFVALLLLWGLYRVWPAGPGQASSPPVAAATSNRNANAAPPAGASSPSARTPTATGSNTPAASASQSPAAAQTPAPVVSQTPATAQTPPASPGAAVAAPSPSPGSGLSPNTGWSYTAIQVKITGTGFLEGATVSFGDMPAPDVSVDSSSSITATTPKHPAGTVDVVITNTNKTSSTIINGFTFVPANGPTEADMILLVIFAGALGGSLHALRSVSWYVGNRDFRWSWYLMYVLLPFVGATIAVTFYLVLRAGLVDPPKTSGGVFAMVGLAALIGLFSQQAALKLKKVAEAVLTTPEGGANSRPQRTAVAQPAGTAAAALPAITKAEPAQGPVAGGNEVTITGTGFTPAGVTVTFGGNNAEVTPPVTATSVKVKAPKGNSGEVDVVVTNSDGKKSKPGKYTYV